MPAILQATLISISVILSPTLEAFDQRVFWRYITLEGNSKYNEFVGTRPVILREEPHGAQPQESTLSDCVIVRTLPCALLPSWQIL
jgi:hypothetical protein